MGLQRTSRVWGRRGDAGRVLRGRSGLRRGGEGRREGPRRPGPRCNPTDTGDKAVLPQAQKRGAARLGRGRAPAEQKPSRSSGGLAAGSPWAAARVGADEG